MYQIMRLKGTSWAEPCLEGGEGDGDKLKKSGERKAFVGSSIRQNNRQVSISVVLRLLVGWMIDASLEARWSE